MRLRLLEAVGMRVGERCHERAARPRQALDAACLSRSNAARPLRLVCGPAWTGDPDRRLRSSRTTRLRRRSAASSGSALQSSYEPLGRAASF